MGRGIRSKKYMVCVMRLGRMNGYGVGVGGNS